MPRKEERGISEDSQQLAKTCNALLLSSFVTGACAKGESESLMNTTEFKINCEKSHNILAKFTDKK